MSKCAYGTPILASFPHFYLGDKNLANQFDGLNPSEEKHNTYADVHPRLAFPLGGVTRFQINVELNDKDNLAFICKFLFINFQLKFVNLICFHLIFFSIGTFFKEI